MFLLERGGQTHNSWKVGSLHGHYKMRQRTVPLHQTLDSYHKLIFNIIHLSFNEMS